LSAPRTISRQLTDNIPIQIYKLWIGFNVTIYKVLTIIRESTFAFLNFPK